MGPGSKEMNKHQCFSVTLHSYIYFIYYSILQIHTSYVQRTNPHAATSIPFLWQLKVKSICFVLKRKFLPIPI